MPDLLPCSLLAAGGVTPVMGLLAVLLVALVLLSLVLMKLRQSLLIGYFACGVAAGELRPIAMAGWRKLEDMTVLADTGVTLLMFTLGIEFSLSELKHLRKAALLGGGLQVALTGGLTAGLALAFGMTGRQAAVLAVAIALSSTAVSMKTFQELSMPASPAARASLGIAIFQDLLVIAFMLLLPMILKEKGSEGRSLLVTGEFVLLFAAIAWVLGKYSIPRLLLSVSRTQSRELFTLTVLALCVSVACLASLMGLSPALGAFVAGLVVSGSIYSHRVLADILPFKDLFLTLFFVTVGLSIDLAVFARHGWWVLIFTVLLLLAKGLILALVCRVLAMPVRSAVMCTRSAGIYRRVLAGAHGSGARCAALERGLLPSVRPVHSCFHGSGADHDAFRACGGRLAGEDAWAKGRAQAVMPRYHRKPRPSATTRSSAATAWWASNCTKS